MSTGIKAVRNLETNKSYSTKLDIKSYNLLKNLIPWMFVLPGIIFTIWLRYYPILKSFYISLFNYNAITPPGEFIGLKNYKDILVQSSYWDAWKNTIQFLILNLLISFIPPLLQAIFLSTINVGRKFFSTIYLLTALIPISVNVVLWKWIWNPDVGAANAILKFIGISPKLWLNDPNWVKFCIVFPGIIGGGIIVLIYLAAILSVPTEISESAQLDGCTGWKRMFYIILPNIKFVIVIQLMMSVIGGLQMLDQPFQYTNGGPAGTSTTIGIFIYNTFHSEIAYGRSSATSVILFVVIAIMTIAQMKLNKSE